MKKIFILLLLISFTSFSKLKIGVSMLPYYSFALNIVEDKAQVIQILPTDVDVHSYQPSATEVKKIADLDVLIINGTGIDNYMFDLVKASNNKKIKIINASKGVSLLPVSGQRSKVRTINTHTFIGIQPAIQQVNSIAKQLAKIDEKNAKFYLTNARKYNRKLSSIKARKLNEISKLRKNTNLSVAATHDGYDYILGEIGMNVAVVVEPASGAKPSASDLKASIDLIRKNKIDILFESDGSTSPYSKQIQRETGVVIEKLLHMTNGEYRKDTFEKDIEKNFDIIIKALKEVAKKKKN